ncbi:MAG: hypothetical protein A3G35_15355 [candidate division NC10 bacterium RIFCSPLOWO2_12_FULL_66_18]|nr:MAG: hypothetical protein A3H39_07200 [candidate division NC10 bacterium RIFCSPLOWO2_02_FULL_66_22]OGC00019.1 MAG: hypothetical protein A3G35_15355 [candidate division NC10 bacterium RIFCSPLOWO2_12_FULL_66_18]
MRLCSFHRPSITIIGHGDTIVLPKQSQRVTAEAELAVIIGRRCKDISVDEVPAVLLGFTTVLDMSAEDILQRNPRFLTRAKSFDTFHDQAASSLVQAGAARSDRQRRAPARRRNPSTCRGIEVYSVFSCAAVIRA